MRTISDLDLTLQARAFVSLYRRDGRGAWREEFVRWADNKGFSDADRLAIEGEAARIHVNGDYDEYIAGATRAVAGANRAMRADD